jgi:uncharacterized damage-inducible protein DinB
MRPEQRRFPSLTGTDRDIINGFLEYQRDTLEWKCSGLSDDQLKTRAVSPSPLTLLGLLRHMTVVEYHWFEFILTGSREHQQLYITGADRAAGREPDWNDLDSVSVEDVVKRWHEACDIARSNVAAMETLDTPAFHEWDDAPVALRWILVHMIEEYARHIGHADFLREKIDGETGE